MTHKELWLHRWRKQRRNMLWRGKADHIKIMKIRNEHLESYWQNRFILDTSLSPPFHPHENLVFNALKFKRSVRSLVRSTAWAQGIQWQLSCAKTAELVNQRRLRHYKDICPHTAATLWELLYFTNTYLTAELLFEVEA